MAVTRLIPNCQKLKLDVLYIIVLYTFNTPLDSVQKGRGSISRLIGCYVCYYLQYGFKISMLVKYNLLLVTTLIPCKLHIFVF